MKIGSANGTTGVGVLGPQMQQGNDSFSKNIQNQIQVKQQELQKLSENENMSLEEKMKKRQEIQQEISDLNIQLRQHQIEQRREQQQAKGSSMDEMLGGSGNTKAESKGTGLSQASMAAMISAGTSMKQAKAQGSAATKMEGRAGVLESEIKLDQARGNDTSKKQEELADVQQKAQAATSSQLSTLADASRTMEKAAQADSGTEKTDDKDIKTAGAKENGVDENISSADTQKETVSGSFTDKISQKAGRLSIVAANAMAKVKGTTYTSNGNYSDTLSKLFSSTLDKKIGDTEKDSDKPSKTTDKKEDKKKQDIKSEKE